MVDTATFNKSLKTTTGNGKNFSILNCENTAEN